MLGTLLVCTISALIGETFFPAELIGDTGGNDFAGLAAVVWALGAFILCVLAPVGYEVYVRWRARKSSAG